MSEPLPTGELRWAVRRGVAWKLTSLAASQGLRIVALIVYARLLTPAELGLAAIALAVWAATSVFTDLALAAALVQRAEIDEQDRSTAFWAGSLSGLILALAGLAVSGWVASFFDEPDLQWLFAALGLSAFAASLSSTQVALLTRAMNFRALELTSIAATVAGTAVGIGLAFADAGAWAIVVSALTASFVTFALVWLVSPWRPRLLFSRQSLRRLIGFASLLSVIRVIVGLQRTLDRLLIGRLLGAAALGLYTIPASIAALPATRLLDPIRGVLFPAFSRLNQSPRDLARAWLRMTRLVTAVLAPVLMLLATTADELVAVALGPRWADAAPILRILALGGLFQLAGGLNAVVLGALDRLALVLRVFSIGAALALLGLALGQRNGLEGATAGYVIGAAAVAPYYAYVTGRALRLSARELFGAYVAQAAGLLVMAAAALAVEAIGADWSAALRLFVHAVVELGLYAAVVLIASPPLRTDLRAAAAPARAQTPP